MRNNVLNVNMTFYVTIIDLRPLVWRLSRASVLEQWRSNGIATIVPASGQRFKLITHQQFHRRESSLFRGVGCSKTSIDCQVRLDEARTTRVDDEIWLRLGMDICVGIQPSLGNTIRFATVIGHTKVASTNLIQFLYTSSDGRRVGKLGLEFGQAASCDKHWSTC